MKKSMKYYGFYRGIVMQCLNNGFCRIMIPGIIEAIDGDINQLPLAEPAQSLGGGGLDSPNGNFMYPDLNSTVWCFFEGGNLDRPVYFATSFMRSNSWAAVSVPTAKNKNKGNGGYTVTPSGSITKYNKSSISQEVILDKQTNLPIGDMIDIKVESTSEQDDMRNQAVNGSMNKDEKGFSNPTAACVHLDNKRNTVTISAKNSIVLRAPNIVIDSTGFEIPGYILIQSNETDNNANNGSWKVMSAKVNIDGGTNDIIIQTLGNIWQLKNTQEGTSEAKEV